MTDQAPGWLTIREASLALGVSELTIRRRIKDGRLAHRLQNGKYYVNPAAPPPLAPEGISLEHHSPTDRVMGTDQSNQISHDHEELDGPGKAGQPASVSIDLDAILTEQARLAEAAGRALLLEERLRQTEERHAALQETLVSLAARNGWLESKLEEREKEVRLLADGQRKRSWWKRLFLAHETGS